ncbi:MAG: DegT/DnrJ/EryC1/StrS family aminotransferase [Ignavibacteriales bacterium]|nr:DegT/DnrJ/EryC1/StrS family aminotransferase [Ignavibacteriales bacterium]
MALYAILKSLNLSESDEVIVPAFTCVVVPNAILYAGLKPVYVDIRAQTYNMDISLVEKAITKKTKVILCQNTFGLSSNIDEIIVIAKKYNLFTIEDCTHGFGGTYNGKPNGSFCDAAFYSSQWNKPFSTGIGGFLVVNNEKNLDEIKRFEVKKVKPTISEKLSLSLLLRLRKIVINNHTYSKLVSLYRYLSKHNLILGSNKGIELKSALIPTDYFKDISDVQVKRGLKVLNSINEINQLRKKNAKDYTKLLVSRNKNHVDESLFDNHLFLKYPLLVKDRDRFLELAAKSKIILGDWFLSPLHPVEKDLERWNLDRKSFLIADSLSKKIINLPTDISDNKTVLKFLEDNLEMVE